MSAETDSFIRGTLSQEAYARSSCLQAIQVISWMLGCRKLTNSSSSHWIWQIWTGRHNYGLPVLMTMNQMQGSLVVFGKITALIFLRISLTPFWPSLVSRKLVQSYSVLMIGLGHPNEYVQSSTAQAIAGALEQYPQAIVSTLLNLENYYCEKAHFCWLFLFLNTWTIFL